MRVKYFSPGVAALVALWALGLGLVLWMQSLLYAHSGPFYDSISYYRVLARSFQRFGQEGFWSAFAGAFSTGTAAMPWIESSFLGFFTAQPKVWMGPLLQAPWVLAFLLTLYAYFRKILMQNRSVSVLAASVFVFNFGVFSYSFAWSDLALDMMAYMTQGCAFLWYFWTWKEDRPFPWLMCGIFFGAACLWRAPAFVNLLLVMGPCELWRLFKSRDRERLVLHWMWGLVPAAVLALPFYIADWPTIYGYYFAPNAANVDAVHPLPLSQSWRHLEFLWDRRLGAPVGAFLLSWGLFRVGLAVAGNRAARKSSRVARMASLGEFFKKINWMYLWAGLAPVGLLVVKGVGLNPWICFPSVFGVLLFLLFPVQEPAKPRYMFLLWIPVLAAFFLSVQEGYAQHVRGLPPRAAEMLSALRTMTRDAQSRGLKEVRYDVPHNGGRWNDLIIEHLLIYDEGASLGRGDGEVVVYRGQTYRAVGVLTPCEIQAACQKGDLRPLQEALKGLDYVYLLEPSSIPEAQKAFGHYVPVSAYLGDLAKASGGVKLSPVGPLFDFPGPEQFRLYRVER